MLRRPMIPLLFLFVVPQLACAAVRPSVSGGYEVHLEDPTGNRLNTYHKNGRTYVLGYRGNRYNIRVTNRTNARIEAVVTVDGRDAISGDSGDYVRQRGYVIDAYDSVLVEGFRQSMAQVAAFRFTSPGDSYAGRRGSTRNVGVIGVAVFKERHRLSHYRPRPIQRPPNAFPRRESAGARSGSLREPAPTAARGSVDSAASASGGLSGARKSIRRRPSANRNRLGTQYGETRSSSAVQVTFHRARTRHPNKVLSVYYDDQRGLAARGIYVGHAYGGEPNPFPGRRFAPPPP